MSAQAETGIVKGDGYAVGRLDDMGDGYGFRKIRRHLDVQAFGINALVIPPGFAAKAHVHDRQEETYFVHQGTFELRFGDGTVHRLGPGGVARVDAATPRVVANGGDDDVVVVVAGGEGGYVGRDGHDVEMP